MDHKEKLAKMRAEIAYLMRYVEILDAEDCDATIDACGHLVAASARIAKMAREIERENNEFWDIGGE